jgi:hypothetical protein
MCIYLLNFLKLAHSTKSGGRSRTAARARLHAAAPRAVPGGRLPRRDDGHGRGDDDAERQPVRARLAAAVDPPVPDAQHVSRRAQARGVHDAVNDGTT